jgi:hypothetical protein
MATLASPARSPSEIATTPIPTPNSVRFDVVNGPHDAIVWITTDAGAAMRGFHPGERGTILAPMFTGAEIDVYGDQECKPLAQLRWLPGTMPATLVLSDDPHGNGYVITVQPWVSGTPVPQSTYLDAACSG